MLNEVQLIGNLGADPEHKVIGSGTSVCDLRVATTRRFKQGEEWTDETEWHRVTVWGKQADSCNQYLHKGSKVHIAGRIKTEKWEDKDGNQRYTTKIIAQRVIFLDSKGDRQGGSQPSSGERKQAKPKGYDKWSNDGPDDDIPF